MYSLLETNQDVGQFLATIHRYVQLGVHIKGYYSQKYKRFHREVSEVVEFYVTEDNKAEYKILYKKTPDGHETIANPTKYLIGYLESQGVIMPNDILVKEQFHEQTTNNDLRENNFVVDNSGQSIMSNVQSNITPNNIERQNINQSTLTNNQNIVNNQSQINNNIPNIYANNPNIPKEVNMTSINNGLQ